MVVVGTGSFKDKDVKRDYPVTSGLVAGTTKQEGRQSNLVAEEERLILEEDDFGL